MNRIRPAILFFLFQVVIISLIATKKVHDFVQQYPEDGYWLYGVNTLLAVPVAYAFKETMRIYKDSYR